MAKIPVRIVSAGTNVAGGLGHRSLGAPGAFVLEDDYGVANIAGGVIPMTQAEYAYAMGAQVVKDLGPTAWFQYNQGITVAGAGVSQWNDQSGNGRHLKQGTDTNRPFYATANALRLPGASGAYASTPDAAANSITGDIDIRAHLSMADWTPSETKYIVAKYGDAGERSYVFQVTATTGVLGLQWSADGTNMISKASTVAPTVTDGAALWIRATLDVDNGAVGNDVKFYTSSDGSTWTQLGDTVTTATATSIHDAPNVTVDIGGIVGATIGPVIGNLYRAQIYDGIDGTLAVDFNPSDTTDGDTSFASSTTGETWTINGTAYLYGVPGSILFDGVDNYLKCDAFTLNQPITEYLLFKAVSYTSTDHITDGNTGDSVVIYQAGVDPTIQLFAGSGAPDNSDMTTGSYGVFCAVFNGASSLSQVNNGTPATGNAGVNNAAGFTLGASGGALQPSNIQVKEVIIFAAAHTAAERARVIAYLMQLGGL